MFGNIKKNYLDEVKKFMKDYPQIEGGFKGCTKNEVTKLEEILNEPIPASFKEFLLWFGESGGLINKGSEFYYNYLSGEIYDSWKEEEIVPKDWNAKKGAIQFLKNHDIDGGKILQNAIVFMNHQGYIFQFIKTNEGEDPPVYIFGEQKHWDSYEPRKWSESFSGYLLQMLKNEIDGLKRIGRLS